MSNWTEHDHPTPEQEREIWAREECERRGIDPDEICADGGVEAWMVIAREPKPLDDEWRACPVCGGPMENWGWGPNAPTGSRMSGFTATEPFGIEADETMTANDMLQSAAYRDRVIAALLLACGGTITVSLADWEAASETTLERDYYSADDSQKFRVVRRVSA